MRGWIKLEAEGRRIVKEKADKERQEQRSKEEKVLRREQEIVNKMEEIRQEAGDDIWRALAILYIEVQGYIYSHKNTHSNIRHN